MFKATRIMAMQPTRGLLMKQTAPLFMKRTPQLYMQQTARLMRPMPKEEHGAHTISQRLRTLRKLPAEIWPLIIVLAFAVFAAFFSLGRKLWVDKTLRLKRSSRD